MVQITDTDTSKTNHFVISKPSGLDSVTVVFCFGPINSSALWYYITERRVRFVESLQRLSCGINLNLFFHQWRQPATEGDEVCLV